MSDTSDQRDADTNALLGFIERTIKGQIDELADLGADDELWRLWEYLWDRVPPRSTSGEVLAQFVKTVEELARKEVAA